MNAMKLITLLISLLLSVGWIDVSAQLLPTAKSFLPQMDYTDSGISISQDAPQANAPSRENATQRPMVSLTEAEAKELTYIWNCNGKDSLSKATDVAYDPEQIYELLKFVYMDPRFPGPYTNAYTSTGVREDPVYYGGVERGWDIPFKSGSGHFEVRGDLTIGLPNGSNTYLSEISVYNADTDVQLTRWTANDNGTNLPNGWTTLNAPLFYSGAMNRTRSGNFVVFTGAGTITIPASQLSNAENVRLVVKGYSTYSATETPLNKGWYGVINVDGIPFDLTGYTANSPLTCENIINRRQWVDTGAKRPTDVLITTNGSGAYLRSITIIGGSGRTYVNWTDLRQGIPSGSPTYYTNKTVQRSNSNGIYFDNGASTITDYNGNGGTIRFPAELFQGESSITVTVVGRGSGNIAVSNKYRPLAANSTITKTIQFPPVEDYETYKPEREGYTALIVSVYDDSGRLPWANYPLDRACQFTTKADVIKYIRDNIQFVKLLTDGIRVGDGENIGTVFRCDGTYNKFFFLGKGQARKKDSGVLASIGTGDPLWPAWACEQLPFHYMYEQFSPTTPLDQSQIEDFYTEMMDGQLYDIVHDCPSVIQNEHQFSMSGNNGTTAYGMTGMNFYIPDYRLKYWTRNHELAEYGKYTQDGRDMNAYMAGGATAPTNIANNQSDHIGVYFGMYNPDHAPKVGVYKITLDATVAPVADYDSVSNPNYEVTLEWVSSLDQMSGTYYPQHYNIYEIVVDKDGNEKLVKVAEAYPENPGTNPNLYSYFQITYDENGNETGRTLIGQVNATQQDPTHLVLADPYPQQDYSQTYTFIIEGWPINSDNRPSFFAWSNPDQVIIPGRTQFMSLKLDHYESDFIINGGSDLAYMKNYNCNWSGQITGEHNYYRNFVTVNSEEVMSGLTIDKINQGMHTFDMLRSTLIPKEEGELKIARLEFAHPVSAGAKEVGFTITYDDNTQYLLANKFQRNQPNMNIPESGTVRVMGNGDLVIQPNGYHVNFNSINVTRGSQTWTWDTTYQSNNNLPNLPSGWYLSPGSLWVQDDPGDPYYLEGGGYIAIPDVINGTQAVTVTINASGDMSTVPIILVDDREKKIETGDAKDYTWTIPVEGQSVSLNYYEKITSVDQITSGSRYLIVCEGRNPSRVLNGSIATNQFNTTSNSGDITISGDNKITTEQGDMFYFTITALDNGRYSIRSNSGNYIGDTGNASNTDNMSASTNTALANSITFDGNGNAIIRNQNNTSQLRETQYNYNGTLYRYFSYFGNQASAYGYSQPIQLYKYVETGSDDPDYGKLRIGALPFVDQFKAETKNDKHPYRYGYQLKEVKSEGANGTNVVYGKASSIVEVPIQHTNSKVNGYFTLDSIDNDIYIKADTNLMTADVLTELSGTNSMVFFNTIQARRKQNPVVFQQYATVLQQQTDFTYKEMKDPSDRFGNIYYPGTHHYFDSLKLTGKYNVDTCKRVYIPSIMTRGIDRRYFTDDTLHNTYGAPIYRTGVGKVELNSATAVLMQDQYGSVRWWDGTDSCNVFCLQDIMATGYLPSNDVSNVDYEPYMFRLYVKSANGKLRPYTQGANGEAIPVDIDPENPTMTHGPVCVWSGYVNSIPEGTSYSDYGEMYGSEALVTNPLNEKDYKYIYEKKMVERAQGSSWDKQKYNAFFGAVKNIVYNANGTLKSQIDPEDLTIYVRFYYIGKGLAEGHTPHIEHSNVPDAQASANAPRRDGEGEGNGYPGPSGYPADSPGYSPGIATAVNEILFHGEVVKTTYYNLQGIESSKPFDGLNIVVNRYSDGTTKAYKVMY